MGLGDVGDLGRPRLRLRVESGSGAAGAGLNFKGASSFLIFAVDLSLRRGVETSVATVGFGAETVDFVAAVGATATGSVSVVVTVVLFSAVDGSARFTSCFS